MNLTILKKDLSGIILLEGCNYGDLPFEYMSECVVEWDKEPSKSREFGIRINDSTYKRVLEIYGEEYGAWGKDVI